MRVSVTREQQNVSWTGVGRRHNLTFQPLSAVQQAAGCAVGLMQYRCCVGVTLLPCDDRKRRVADSDGSAGSSRPPFYSILS